MITISKAVEDLIKNKPFLVEAISEGIINFSGLARKIKPEIEFILKKEVNSAAIIVALKRCSATLSLEMFGKLNKMLKNLGEVIIRSNLVEITYTNSKNVLKNRLVFEKEDFLDKQYFYTISRGVFETTFVLSKELLEDIKKIFYDEIMKSYISGLSSITIKLPRNNTKQPGLYYSILKNIAWEGISVYESISTTNEFTIVVNETEIEKSLGAINKLKRL